MNWGTYITPATAFGAVGAASAAYTLISNYRRRRRERVIEFREDEEHKYDEHFRLIMTTLEEPALKERIMDIIVSSDRVRARMRDDARAVFIEELASSPEFERLREAVDEVKGGMNKIEAVFIAVGMRNVVQPSKPLDDTLPIRNPGKK